jgi:hypothetical protein
MTDQSPPEPRAARILCAITFHFSAERLVFLAEVMRSLAEFPVALLDIVIVTNTADKNEVARLDRLAAEAHPDGRPQVRSFPRLADPFDLTWSHKTILADAFAGSAGRYTHFIYLEDDIRLSFANFAYFVEWRERLRPVGLLPAFVRTEYNAILQGFVASDAFWPVYVPTQTHVRLGDTVMVNMPNPYNPCFIVDAALADEHMRSRSFDKDASLEVCRWGVRERAAMGLCLENVPAPFQSRYVVPASLPGGALPVAARISHLPNTYARTADIPLGKVRLDALFDGARTLDDGGWWPTPEGDADQSVDHERYFLVSHHDTILFLDEAARRLGHAPFGIAPMNVVIELVGRRGRLLCPGRDIVDGRTVTFAAPTGEVRMDIGYAEDDLAIEYFFEGSIGVRTGDFYLCADLDGFVHNDRRWCRQFERFRLVREDNVAGFALLQRHSWISDADGRIAVLTPQPIDFARDGPHESSALAATLAPGALDRRRDIVFGAARLRLTQRQRLFEIEAVDGSGLPSKIVVTDITGTRHRFSREDRRAALSEAFGRPVA